MWIVGIVKGGINAGQTSDQLKEYFQTQKSYANSVAEADKSVATSAMQTISRLNAERAGMYHQVTSALASIQSQQTSFKGTTAAGNAATGTTGASAQAALADADIQAGKAQATVLNNMHVSEDRILNNITDVTKRATQQFQAHNLSNVMSKAESTWRVFDAFVSSFMGTKGAYDSVGSLSVPNAQQSSTVSTDQTSAFNQYGTGGWSGSDSGMSSGGSTGAEAASSSADMGADSGSYTW